MPDEEEFGGMIDEGEMARMYSGEQDVPPDPSTGDEEEPGQQAASTDDDDLYPDMREQEEDTLLEMEGEDEPVNDEEEEVDERGVSWKNRAKEYERKLKELEAKQKPEGQAQQPQHPLPPPLPGDVPLQPQGQMPYPQQPPMYPQQQQVNQQPQPAQPQVPHFETTEQLVAYVQDMAQREAQGIIQQQKAQQQIQESEGRILNDFPDMSNQQSPIFQWARYFLHTNYNGDLRYAEDAAHRAARQLGIQPRSQVKEAAQPKALPRVKGPLPSSEASASTKKESWDNLPPRAKKLAKMWGQDFKDVAKYHKQLEGV